MMGVRLLGSVTLTTDDGGSVEVQGAEVRAVLALLAIDAGAVVPAPRLASELWGDALEEDERVAALVARLREALGAAGLAGALERHDGGHRLAVDRAGIDVSSFEQRAAAARRHVETGDLSAAATTARSALDLWQGDPFAGATDTPSLRAEATRLAKLRQLALTLAGEAGASVVAPVPRRPPPRTNLPTPLTSFVGRHKERGEIQALLGTHRLLTVSGPAGVGKTRLVVETAAGLVERYPDGIRLVELASWHDAAVVAPAVATALGLRELPDLSTGPVSSGATERVAAHLRTRRLLLVLDSCEHLIAAAGELVARLLPACPGLHVLATSREPLGVGGEVTLALAPLAVPDGGGPSDALRLFWDRARAAAPSVDASAPVRAAAAAVCRRLDGLPLAIELAAAPMRTMSVADVATRLEERFGSSGRGTTALRQRTLRATIDWSHDLLDDQAKLAFAHVAVFAGEFTAEHAAAVIGPREPDGSVSGTAAVTGALACLAEHGLVTAEPVRGGPVRYRVGETLRAYAREQLAEREAVAAAAERHAALLLAIAEQADAQLRGPHQAGWLAELDDLRGDLAAALTFARAHAGAWLVRMTAALGWYWWLRGTVDEGADWCEAALEVDAGPAARARTLVWAGLLSAWRGDVAAAADHASAGVAAYGRLADPAGLALARLGAAAVATARREHERALALLDDAEPGFAAAEDPWGLAVSGYLRGVVARASGHPDVAAQSAQAALGAFRQVGDHWGVAGCLDLLATLAEASGDYGAAAAHLEESVKTTSELGLGTLAVTRQGRRAHVAMLAGDDEHARALYVSTVQEASALGADNALARALNGLGMLARRAGDLDEAARHHRRALDRYVPPVRDAGRALTFACLGFVAEERGDPGYAHSLHTMALAHADTAGDVAAQVLAVEGLAGAAAAGGDPAEAAELLGLADVLRQGAGPPGSVADQGDADRVALRARTALGDGGFAAAHARGRRRTVGELLGE